MSTSSTPNTHATDSQPSGSSSQSESPQPSESFDLNPINCKPETVQTIDSKKSLSISQILSSCCLTYFWVGQKLSISRSHSTRKILSILIPLSITWIIWWIYAIESDSFWIFSEEINGISRYYMSITMIFGSIIAGISAEGGASVAFPVMTLAFGISPIIARNFSFMIQSVGMSAASFSILLMRVQIEYKSILYCSIGGVFGIFYCLRYIAHHLAPPFSKMYFVSIWFAFAFSLFYLNRTHDRKVYDIIPKWSDAKIFKYFNWKAIVLLIGGFIGGIFSGIAGSGIDICSFAILTLLFRVSEKTATPTSIILMSINTFCGFAYNFTMSEISNEAWSYFFVCVPIVVIGAPFGSIVGSYLHRRVLATFVYITDSVQLIAAIAIVQPWKISWLLVISSCAFVAFGGLLFSAMTYIGLRIMNNMENETNKAKDINDVELTTNGRCEIMEGNNAKAAP